MQFLLNRIDEFSAQVCAFARPIRAKIGAFWTPEPPPALQGDFAMPATLTNFAGFSSPTHCRSRHITSGAVMPISAINQAELHFKL
jgi:hypothetical protein